MFFITVGFVGGMYFILSEIIPKSFSLNDTTHTWEFSSATAVDYSYDPALISITDDGAKPTGGQIGANEFANASFDEDNTSWTTEANTPPGWITAPGSVSYGTGDFLVMQYEAKYDCTGDGIGDTAAACSAGADSGLGLDRRDIVSFNPNNVVSTAQGAPIVHITNPQAFASCPVGYKLLTNDQWMTLARNIEVQSDNWANGIVGGTVAGGGGLKRGNVGIDDGASYNGQDPDYGTGRNQKAKHVLSNGKEIWDLSGNVWEHVAFDANGNGIYGENPGDLLSEQDQPEARNASATVRTGFDWSGFTSADPAGGSNQWYLQNDGSGEWGYDDFRPLNSSYTAVNGVGRIYHSSNSSSSTKNRVVLRGGYWNDQTNAGVFATTLNNSPGFQNNFVGFRCASDSVEIFQSFSSSSGRTATGGNEIAVGSVIEGTIYQELNLGDTQEYALSVYVYDATTGNEGGAVNNTIAQLYYNGETISTNYQNTGGGWWKLSGTVTGANEARKYGLMVKKDKNVYTDDFTLARTGDYTVYTTAAYTHDQVVVYDTFCPGVFVDGICSNDGLTSASGMDVLFQLCDNDGPVCESGNLWKYYDETEEEWLQASNITTHTNTAAQLTPEVIAQFDPANKALSVKFIFEFEGAHFPTAENVSVGLTTDTVPPPVNASDIEMKTHLTGREVINEGWANDPAPYFSWTPGADNEDGSGLRGYCLYLGTDVNGDPTTDKGLLGNSPVSTTGTTCGFIAGSNSVDFENLAYRGTTWLTSSNNLYYLNIKAVDNAGLTYTGSSVQFAFYYDDTPPTNVSYINPASGSFSNVNDMNFSWPVSGGAASSDANSGVLGWQYSVNSQDNWRGTTEHPDFELEYIPVGFEQPYYLDSTKDGADIFIGDNIIYFRTIDDAGNASLPATYRTGNLSYGGAAPTFGGDAVVTVTPNTSTINSFAFSWPAATPADGESIDRYYYMINTLPPVTLATLTGNSSTYIPTTSTSVSASSIPGVQKGANTVRVVAVDTNGNYSPSNVISGTFTLNSNNPDPAKDLAVSDASIKAAQLWRASLAWDTPDYTGTGTLTYVVQRSVNGTSWTTVTTTGGNAYVDTVPESRQYFWRVGTRDTSDLSVANPSFTNAVTLTPRGTFDKPAELTSGPVVVNASNRRAQIQWTTNRASDSRVAFGTAPGEYFTEEPANSAQVTAHTINLNNLSPGITYYYRARWTDEDGNTGESVEHGFTTLPAPTVTNPRLRQVGLTNAILQYTVSGSNRVKVYYGTTTSFGGVTEIATASSESTYTTELSGLEDGRLYYYKINTVDSEGFEYEGSTLTFSTLPRPEITNVRIQQVKNAAQPTILVSWESNTETTSVVSLFPERDPLALREEVNLEMISGEHQMIIRGLLPDTVYSLTVKGSDVLGNQASSTAQRLTTATDTRPPAITNLRVETSKGTVNDSAQLIVTWTTDEPTTTQVEYGEGTGDSYGQRSQLDSNLTLNHTVVISGLTPGKVYHLRALVTDDADNTTESLDYVAITPKAGNTAIELVINSLAKVFSFLRT